MAMLRKNRRTHRWLAGVLVLSSAFALDGWRPLFNGRDLDGWIVEAPAFSVDDAAVCAKPGRGVMRYTRLPIGSGSTLRLVYRIANPAGRPAAVVRVGRVAVRLSDGAIDRTPQPLADGAKPGGEWNTMDITLADGAIRVMLNGVLATDDRSAAALPPADIAIDQRGDPSAIYFREISVKQ
jgi:hypothetical protein